MFLRCHSRKKNGKLHRYWSVVESRRVAGGDPVQRHVLYLGEINDSQEAAWAMRVWEPQTPAGEEPIEWVLLTDVPTADAPAALLRAEWYALRWLIEEYHKCLKSGCGVEARQMETAERLAACIVLLAVVAVRLLQLKHTAWHAPQRPAAESVSADHVRVLAAYRGRAAETFTAYEFWREVAKLGGSLARRRDGEPGWQTLWRGWRDLDLMTCGARLGRGGTPRCG